MQRVRTKLGPSDAVSDSQFCPSAVPSPLVEGASAILVDQLRSDAIINGYQETYGIDVSEYFSGLETVSVFECQATGYRFYFPYSLVGRENLYRHLEKFDWNYKDEKWEYSKALDYFREGSRILDVGCGHGAFVEMATQFGLDA